MKFCSFKAVPFEGNLEKFLLGSIEVKILYGKGTVKYVMIDVKSPVVIMVKEKL